MGYLRTRLTPHPSPQPHHFLLHHVPHLIPRGPSLPSLCLSSRKVLNKLNFSVPEDVMRKIAQCAPGVVELVLIPLRQRLEERQRRRKQGTSSLQVPPCSNISHCFAEASQAAGSPTLLSVGEGSLAEGAWPWRPWKRYGIPWG